MPTSEVKVRQAPETSPVLVMARHAPTPGVTYDPFDDLLISFVMSSSYCNVVRDVGMGRHMFREGPGFIDITPPRTASYWHYDGTPQVLHMCVPDAYWNSFLAEQGIEVDAALKTLARRPIYDPLVSNLASRIWHHAAFSDNLSVGVVDRLFAALMMLLIVEHGERSSDQSRRARNSALAPWRLERVLAIMAESLDRTLSLKELADSVGLSAYHFQRAFTVSTGRTPLGYQSEMRMENAKILLKDERLRITDIAYQLGYSSPGHFSNRFKQIIGTSPKDWRKTFA